MLVRSIAHTVTKSCIHVVPSFGSLADICARNMWNQDNYYEKLLDGWERSETSEGIPYYINHNRERTQWDHPLIVKTMEELVDMDSIRYAAYRTAMKLRLIQKKLTLDLVDLSTVEGVFERHGLPSSRDTVIDSKGLYNVLVDIFMLTRKTEISRLVDKEQSAELALNWLLNLFDVNRSGCIRVLSVKISLAALCSARLTEKYRYMFKQLRDHTNHISRRKMAVFIHDMMQIPEQINESAPFGGINITPAVDSCFEQSWNTTGIAEDVFITWLLREPQTIVWLPTIHRMAAAESVKHETKCNICKVYPIIGFRYKCLKCFNYDMCQQCFFTGRISKKHKLKHPTQEYCLPTTSKDDTKAFMKTVRNNLSRKYRNRLKLRYLPIYGHEQPYNKEDVYGELGSPDTHSSMQKIAGRLAEVEDGSPRSNDNDDKLPNYKEITDIGVPEISPEHSVPVQKLKNMPENRDQHDKSGIYLAGTERRELENIIQQLDNENKELLNEIGNLGLHHEREEYDTESEGSGSEREWLQDEKEIFQVKQEILESHNKQLEYQLQRLRNLICQDKKYSGERSPLAPVSTNIMDENVSPTLAKKYVEYPTDGTSDYTLDVSNELPKGRSDYTPHHPQLPPAYAQSGELKGQPNQSFFSNSLLVPVPHSAIHHRHLISPIKASSQNSTLERKRDAHARRSLDSTQGLSALEVDITYGSMEPTLGQTHFSLPKVNHSIDYDDDEAEMDELLQKLDKAYPADMTHSMILENRSTMNNMYKAAQDIGDVLGDIASPGAAYLSGDISAILAGNSTAMNISDINYTN